LVEPERRSPTAKTPETVVSEEGVCPDGGPGEDEPTQEPT
jgi:hypothetical protein